MSDMNTPNAPHASSRTLEQRRAAHAWDCIDDLPREKRKVADEYRDLARKFPGMVQTNGLGQSLAFLASKAKWDRTKQPDNAPAHLLTHITSWLCDAGNRPVYTPTQAQAQNPLRLTALIAQGSSRDLRLATLETLALAVWIKRFAEATENVNGGPNAAQSR